MPTCSSASRTARRSSAPGRRIGPEPREAAHHHDVLDGDRERPVHELGLGDVCHAPGLATRRRAEDLDPAGPRLEEPRHELEQRALAGAVGPDDGEQAARLDRDRDVLQRGAVAVARRDVAQPHVRVGVGMRRVERAVVRVRCTAGMRVRFVVGGGGGQRVRHMRLSINYATAVRNHRPCRLPADPGRTARASGQRSLPAQGGLGDAGPGEHAPHFVARPAQRRHDRRPPLSASKQPNKPTTRRDRRAAARDDRFSSSRDARRARTSSSGSDRAGRGSTPRRSCSARSRSASSSSPSSRSTSSARVPPARSRTRASSTRPRSLTARRSAAPTPR